MTDRGAITVNQLRADDGMEGWEGGGGGGESEGCGRGRGTIYLDLKGEVAGVGEDTEERDKWALMVGLRAQAGRARGWLLRQRPPLVKEGPSRSQQQVPVCSRIPRRLPEQQASYIPQARADLRLPERRWSWNRDPVWGRAGPDKSHQSHCQDFSGCCGSSVWIYKGL